MPKPDPSTLSQLALQRAMESPPATDIYAMSSDYVARHVEHKKRILKLDALVNGNWGTVWPDGTVTDDLPKVADFVSSDLEDITSLVASPEPSTIVHPASDNPRDIKDATKRQHILATYRHFNKRSLQRHTLAMDLAATGLACEVIWPDFSAGLPRYVRRNPRHVYPDPDATEMSEVSSVIISYRIKARILQKAYPGFNFATELFTKYESRDFEESDIEVVEFYDGDWCIKVAATPRKGTRYARALTLAELRNPIGVPLASIASRTTVDGQFRGQFDKSISPLGTANKMMEMKLAQLSDEIYAEKIVRGVFDNPDDIGPGATLFTTDIQAGITRAETARSSVDFYNDIQLLLGQSREAGGVPQARHGEVDQNIISAQGITALQGKFNTLIGKYQLLMADLEQRGNSKALAVDQAFLDWTKPLANVVGGRSFTSEYTPSVDIAGRYQNRVLYGAGASMDAYNRRLANIQDVQYGLVSRRHARAQLPDVEDITAMEAEIAREQVEQGIVASLADPAAMDLPTRLRFGELVQSGLSVLEAGAVIQKELAEQQAQQQSEATALEQALGVAPGASQTEESLPQLAPLASLRG